jgi:predicted Zn-dependent peptidase
MMRLTMLSNGLKVASRTMPEIETVTVGLFADVGSRHEAVHESGLAHLFEHMVFKGAGGRSARAIAEVIEDVGGDLNAATSRDSTLFSARLLSDDLALGVEIIADLVRHPHFEDVELEREKRVVLQELGEARDTPGDIVFDHLQAVAFPGQALGRSILGDERSLAGLARGDLERWRRERYRPDGLMVVAAGKVDHAALVDIAEARFGDLVPVPAAPVERAMFAGGSFSDARRFEQAHLTLAWPGPKALSDDYFAARLFADAVGGGMSSRLFQSLREERGLAYSVYASLQAFDDIGMLSVYLATARRDAAAALALVREQLHSAAAALQPAELERARSLVKAGLLMSLESTEGQAAYVARQLSLHGRLVEPAEVVAQIDAITLDEVRAAGAAMLAGPEARASVGAGEKALAA